MLISLKCIGITYQYLRQILICTNLVRHMWVSRVIKTPYVVVLHLEHYGSERTYHFDEGIDIYSPYS